MIYVYAIAEPGPPVAAPLACVEHRGLVGIHSPPPPDLEPTHERLREHERVVEDLMEGRALLPLRFGSLLDGEDELRDLLDARHAEFTAALERVRGRVELGVRASVGGPRGPRAAAEGGAVAARPGTEFLGQKFAAKRAAQELHDELAPAAGAAKLRMVADRFSGAYLVDRAAVPRFRSRVDRLQERHPELDIAFTGPWPPYSFTDSA